MQQLLLLLGLFLCLLLFSKDGNKFIKRISKNEFPNVIVLVVVIFIFMKCTTNNKLFEGMNHGTPSPNMTLQDYCQSGMANPTLSTQGLCESMHTHEDPTQKENDYSQCLFNPPISSEKCLQPSPSQDYIRDLWLDRFNYHSDPENPPWPTGCPSPGIYERANRPHSLDVIGDCMPYLNSN